MNRAPIQIHPQLFISGKRPVYDERLSGSLHDAGITHVLTVRTQEIPTKFRSDKIVYRFCYAEDHCGWDFFADNKLEQCLLFISDVISNGGNILVHCELGKSRSVTVICSYLMRLLKLTPNSALTAVRFYCCLIQPNSGFLQQLSIFHENHYRADSEALRNCDSYLKWRLSIICDQIPIEKSNELFFIRDSECEKIDQIIPGLFISGSHVVRNNCHLLQRLGIIQILSLTVEPIADNQKVDNISYYFEYMLDVTNQDLLANGLLERCLTFIEECRNSGNSVLVHCEMGISRSAAVICAYLMRINKIDHNMALKFIRKIRPICAPNIGFLRQLVFFAQMEYRTDFEAVSKCDSYRDWCFKMGISAPPPPSVTKNSLIARYKCSRCRNVLFGEEDLVKHCRKDSQQVCNFGYLLESRDWMDLRAFETKLSCPYCREKLGNYTWGGRICRHDDDCGAWIGPWILINKKKVDKSLVSGENDRHC